MWINPPRMCLPYWCFHMAVAWAGSQKYEGRWPEAGVFWRWESCLWFFYLFVVVWGFLFVYEISQKKANLFHMATYVQYVALNQVGINWSLNNKCHFWLSGWYLVWYCETRLWQMPSPEHSFYFIMSFASASSCKQMETPTTLIFTLQTKYCELSWGDAPEQPRRALSHLCVATGYFPPLQ